MIDVAAITEWTRANRRARAAYYSDPINDPCAQCGERPRYGTESICNPCKYQNRKKRTA